MNTSVNMGLLEWAVEPSVTPSPQEECVSWVEKTNWIGMNAIRAIDCNALLPSICQLPPGKMIHEPSETDDLDEVLDNLIKEEDSDVNYTYNLG